MLPLLFCRVFDPTSLKNRCCPQENSHEKTLIIIHAGLTCWHSGILRGSRPICVSWLDTQCMRVTLISQELNSQAQNGESLDIALINGIIKEWQYTMALISYRSCRHPGGPLKASQAYRGELSVPCMHYAVIPNSVSLMFFSLLSYNSWHTALSIVSLPRVPSYIHPTVLSFRIKKMA